MALGTNPVPKRETAMSATITYRASGPAGDMTRDETVAWLLGLAGPQRFLASLAASHLITAMVDSLARRPGMVLDVTDKATGQAYVLSATVAGHWYRRSVTYHARQAETAPPLGLRPARASASEEARHYGRNFGTAGEF